MKKEKLYRITTNELFSKSSVCEIPAAKFTGEKPGGANVIYVNASATDKKQRASVTSNNIIFPAGNYCILLGNMKRKISYLFISCVIEDAKYADGIVIKKFNLSRKISINDITKAGWHFQPKSKAGIMENEVRNFFFGNKARLIGPMHINLSSELQIVGFSSRENIFNYIYKNTAIIEKYVGQSTLPSIFYKSLK
ncbi:MAG: hypothetical protein WAV11_02185 [Minisyncoccia bacterium]